MPGGARRQQGQREIEELGLGGPTLSFLNFPLETVGKQRGSQDEATGEGLPPRAHGRTQIAQPQGCGQARGLLYRQVARSHF